MTETFDHITSGTVLVIGTFEFQPVVSRVEPPVVSPVEPWLIKFFDPDSDTDPDFDFDFDFDPNNY
jgi:hypothetical protein